MKIAIVHDYLNQMGGAERVVAVLHEMFPEAPIFTSIVDREILPSELSDADIYSSWMQKLPGIKQHFKKYLLFYPKAIESFDLRDFDLIISSSSAFAKGAIRSTKGLHICYCYTPMRFVWDFENYISKENIPFLFRFMLPWAIGRMQDWDIKTRNRPDYYVAISTVVQERLRKYYGVEAEVIFPPIDARKFEPVSSIEDFYLIVSRLNAYKRIDLAVKAFNRLGYPLRIIGTGPFESALREMARSNISFLGRLEDREVAFQYAHCKAFVFPGTEDFGLTPLEANAAGRPAIAFKGGGALDTIQNGLNGLFFEEPTVDSLIQTILAFEKEKSSFNPSQIRDHALQFDKSVFKNRLTQYIKNRFHLRKEGCT